MTLEVAAPIIEWYRHKGGHRRAHMMINGVWACRWAMRSSPWPASAIELVKEFAKDGRPFGTVCDQCAIARRRLP